MTLVRNNKHGVPHYLTGLGEGISARAANQEEEGGDDDGYISYLRKSARDRNTRLVDHAAAAAAYRHQQQQAENSNAASNKAWDNYYYPPASLQHDPTNMTSIGPWQIAAFALLGAVILLSALFLHILADSTHQQHAAESSFHHHLQQQQPQHGGKTSSKHRRRESRNKSKFYKKKTDDWSDDETDMEVELLSESVREGVHSRRQESSLQPDLIEEPLVYDLSTTTISSNPSNYPYHHHHSAVQQQSRQRKNSSTQQQPSRNIYQAPAYRYPTPGNFSPTFSPSIVHRATATPALAGPLMPQQQQPQPQPRNSSHHHHHHVVGTMPDSSMGSEEGIRLQSGVSSMESFGSPLSNHGNAASNSSSGSQKQPQLQPRPSVCSTGRNKTSPTVTIREPIREEMNTTPNPGPRELVLPPPVNSLVDKTPRVRNSKLLVDTPAAAAAATCNTPDKVFTPSPTRQDSHIEVDTGTEDAFVMPFLPNLNTCGGVGAVASASQQDQDQSDQPPEPVNLDALQLYNRMESGNVFWQRPILLTSPHASPRPTAVAPGTPSVPAPNQLPPLPPPPPIQDDAPPSLRGDISEHFKVMQDSIDDTESLDSNDPRKNIQHKRPDMLMDTDAARSLQGAVNFDDLELQEVIGGGGFGQVWKAMWNGTPVAVKVLTGSAQAHQVPRAIVEEFAAEINLLKGMRHPNICLYMGACLAPPNRAIITELAANGSLWDALRLPLTPPYAPSDGVSRQAWPMTLYQPDPRHGVPPSSNMRTVPLVPPKGTWPWVLVKKVACGSARGMNYLHNGKPPVLHRDLKSANILLDEAYTPKVCDFGLSRLKATQDRSMTGNCGTVQWMAPEVLANQAYNEKADIYSYGIILWELLTRQCPNEDMTAIQCALAVLNRNHRPEIPRWCPPPMQVLIRSCVKKNPDERPSFAEILQALDEMP